MSGPCSWCGRDVAADDGFRLVDPEHDRQATFCRLEHVVPWAMRGPAWESGRGLAIDDDGRALGVCAHCGDELGEDRVLLVRHRGRHRIGDAFCDVDHLAAWARRGGRFRAGA